MRDARRTGDDAEQKAERNLSFTRDPRAVRRRRRQQGGRGRPVSLSRARGCSRWCRCRAPMSTPISRRRSSKRSAPARRSISRSIPSAGAWCRASSKSIAPASGVAVFAAAARQRDRQFHQGRAARSRCASPSRPRRSRSGALRPGLSVVATDPHPRREPAEPDPARHARLRRQGARERRQAVSDAARPRAGRLAPSTRFAAAPARRLHLHGVRHVHGDPGHPDRLGVAVANPGRPVGLAGRGHLGPDRLSDRRSDHDPAVGLSVARLLDARSSSPSRPPASR